VLTDWIGDDGFVKSLGFQMRRPNFVGETISTRGRVKKKGPGGRVDLELWIENAGQVTVAGTAAVVLPVRS
jgi:acyl dehydratase